MVMKFTNNATSTLASGINSSVTSLTVASGNGALFPTLGAGDYFYCTLANTSGTVEIVKVTARTTDTFTVTRGQDGTSGVAWNSGDKVELRLVAASLNDIPKLDEANTFTAANALGTPASVTLTNGTGLPLTSGVTGTLPVANGGTGAATLTANNVLLGNGTSAVQVVAPGANGNVLQSNGTTWTSVTPSGASGTVTSIATNNGLTGGTITTSGTIGLDVYNGTNSQYTSYAIGTSVLVASTTAGYNSSVNGSNTLWTSRYAGGNDFAFGPSSPGSGSSSCAGTWRCRGQVAVPCRDSPTLLTRTA